MRRGNQSQTQAALALQLSTTQLSTTLPDSKSDTNHGSEYIQKPNRLEL
jgi:hypothetical protein